MRERIRPGNSGHALKNRCHFMKLLHIRLKPDQPTHAELQRFGTELKQLARPSIVQGHSAAPQPGPRPHKRKQSAPVSHVLQEGRA